MKFSTAGGGGDLFCGYQANTLKTFEASAPGSSSFLPLSSRGTLAAIDAKCANVTGREVLTAGEIALTFTSSATVSGSFPLYGNVAAPVEAKTETTTTTGTPSTPPSPRFPTLPRTQASPR